MTTHTRHTHTTPEDTCDLLVIGSGAGALSAAVTAAHLGLKVVVIEKDPHYFEIAQRRIAEAEAAQKRNGAGRDGEAGVALQALGVGEGRLEATEGAEGDGAIRFTIVAIAAMIGLWASIMNVDDSALAKGLLRFPEIQAAARRDLDRVGIAARVDRALRRHRNAPYLLDG